MGTSTAFAGQALGEFLNGTAIANIADNAATAPLTNLYMALHSADPGAGGTQSTSEVAYTGYARAAIARTPGSPAWTITGDVAKPNADVVFPQCTGGTATATYASLGIASSGATQIMWSGPLSASIAISNTIIPTMDHTTTSVTLT